MKTTRRGTSASASPPSRRRREDVWGEYFRAMSRGWARTRREASRREGAITRAMRKSERSSVGSPGTDVITAEAREAKSSATTCLRIRQPSEAARAPPRTVARPPSDASSITSEACRFNASIPSANRVPPSRASPCAPAPSDSCPTPSACDAPSSPAPSSASPPFTTTTSRLASTTSSIALAASFATDRRMYVRRVRRSRAPPQTAAVPIRARAHSTRLDRPHGGSRMAE